MSNKMTWHLYNAEAVLVASSNEVELLAAAIGVLGERATIRDSRKRILWTEGEQFDGIAFNSYDEVAEKCYERCEDE